eukprot:CAMPEP_0195102406 /NCGR_PEP_ID=MMETSP0448-20130528/67488_1 /TAXON_ID=66468 /ORGANISM="Heterocapsa triquestra, Strain CCMP 448" /LENGTH=59 /DNA_ID=CAMNT_0040137891 /DNA_START=42 /DNA_END=218 /DNA_ORIENTATION=-
MTAMLQYGGGPSYGVPGMDAAYSQAMGMMPPPGDQMGRPPVQGAAAQPLTMVASVTAFS